jgi:hypothetical protein
MQLVHKVPSAFFTNGNPINSTQYFTYDCLKVEKQPTSKYKPKISHLKTRNVRQVQLFSMH